MPPIMGPPVQPVNDKAPGSARTPPGARPSLTRPRSSPRAVVDRLGRHRQGDQGDAYKAPIVWGGEEGAAAAPRSDSTRWPAGRVTAPPAWTGTGPASFAGAGPSSSPSGAGVRTTAGAHSGAFRDISAPGREVPKCLVFWDFRRYGGEAGEPGTSTGNRCRRSICIRSNRRLALDIDES